MNSIRTLTDISHRILESIPYYLQGLYKKFTDDEILFISSGLAFNVLLCLIPLVLLLTSAVGVFLSSSDVALQRLDIVLDTIFPVGPYGEQIRETIKGVVADIIAYRTSAGVMGLVVMIWTTTWLFSAIRSVLHRVYRTSDPGNVLIGTLRDALSVIMIGVLFVVTNSLTWVYSVFERVLSPYLNSSTPFGGTIAGLTSPFISFFLTTLMFYIAYRYIPNERPLPRVALISAVTTGVFWELASRGFSLYLSMLRPFAKVYGTYAFLLVTLVWVYYSSFMFVVGGEMGQLYRERKLPAEMKRGRKRHAGDSVDRGIRARRKKPS